MLLNSILPSMPFVPSTDVASDVEFAAFRGAFPSSALAERTTNEADLARAIQAYKYFYATVSIEGFMEGQRELGVPDNESAMLLNVQQHHLLFGGTSDHPLMSAVLDLDRLGPVVVQLPPGPYSGFINDHNGRWLIDLGRSGPDLGRGGRYLILPSDYIGRRVDFHCATSVTAKILVHVRSVREADDGSQGFEALRRIQIYPLGDPARRLAHPVDCSRLPADFTCLAWECNLHYWRMLHSILEDECRAGWDPIMCGLLRSLGIEQGRPFEPDPRMSAILHSAARAGRSQMLVAAFADQERDRLVWPDRQWEWPTGLEAPNFASGCGVDFEARERWFIRMLGSSPNLIGRKDDATGSTCWITARDDNGAYLEGGSDYRLTLPAPVPGRSMWSITLYDAETRSQIQSEVGPASFTQVPGDQGAESGPVELRVGPMPCDRREPRQLSTIPGRAWFATLRLYGPDRAAFAGFWRPGDFTAR